MASLLRLQRPLGELASGVKPTRLYTHRKVVVNENEQEFRKLNAVEYCFGAIDEGTLNKNTKDLKIFNSLELQEFRNFPLLPKLDQHANSIQTSLTTFRLKRRLNSSTAPRSCCFLISHKTNV